MTNGFTTAIPDRCKRCNLRGAALCRAVGAHPTGTRPSRLQRFDRDAMIHGQGEIPGFLGVLRKGYLRKERLTRDGRRTLLSVAFPGDIVGGFPERRTAYALEAATDAQICAFDMETVRRMMETHGLFGTHILRELSDQYESQLELIWRRGALTSRERIIAFLVMAADAMPVERLSDGAVVITVMLSRADWADLTNTTVESISRTLGQLSEKGLVERLPQNRYKVRDLDLLARMAGMDPEYDRLVPERHVPSGSQIKGSAVSERRLMVINANRRGNDNVRNLSNIVADRQAPAASHRRRSDEQGSFQNRGET